ncbi:D5 family helicase-primase [Bodo saltans virus]|uniref:D5 family helicase-primase n=1 Tax=Bodo saltans virus TaxID=2024608 RepID=A0A2H4UU97_9VIRU|nr:D5 family helicase-primase [Bodo saltans virus]ATZ80427.1 D5 family helicase-primase [Bodo saltans virus]
MKKCFEKYNEKNLCVFNISITHEKNKQGVWKKNIKFPKDWTKFTMNKTFMNDKSNGVAMITGKINDIIVIDIDNVEHWTKFLQKHNQQEPDTVKAISGSGGIHLFFKYDEELENITSSDHKFGKDYDIDLKTNGGCIIVAPSSYHNENLQKDVKYEWKKSIFAYDPIPLPKWIKNILLGQSTSITKKDIKKKKLYSDSDSDDEIIELVNTKTKIAPVQEPVSEAVTISDCETNIVFCPEDIEYFVSILCLDRGDNYTNWLNIGMCLYNLSPDYLYIWRKWSKHSKKYVEGDCESKWKSFKKSKDGLKIGSLLLWCKTDNKDLYENYINKYKMSNLVLSKFPNDKLIVGDTIQVNKKCSYIHLHNEQCLIKGSCHTDLPHSMYIERFGDHMCVKCKHLDCWGKVYPNEHIHLTKQEMNVLNYNVTNITNYFDKDDDLVDFNAIDIYENETINNLIYNGLNGKAYTSAEIIYYYYRDIFNYGENGDWYTYENHKWENIGQKNIKLRHLIQPKLKELYTKLIDYYKQHDNDKKKINAIVQIIKSFDDTNTKNNILTELMELFSENNNKHRNFVKKLDSNNYLIGFNNGVYDLNALCFREGLPSDCITMSVNYNYQEHHTEKYNELLQFLEDIQPNKDERDYMLTYLSIGLVGNFLELFTILTGCGRNGKSKLVELLKTTLGDYFGSVQSQLFTRPRPDANSPDPGLLNLLHKKIVIASEPEKNEKLNSGFIKFITGRDSTTLRQCHQNEMIDFTANFLTLLICNDIPDCDDIDNAFSKRLRCIHFPTEFVTNPTKDNQKKINVNINQNFDYWKIDFMLLLIQHYKKYTETQILNPTNDILKWTDQYKENTDIYLTFINECTETSDVHTHTPELYDAFKIWFKNNNPGVKIPSNKEFIANLRKYKTIERFYYNQKQSFGIKNLKIINNYE